MRSQDITLSSIIDVAFHIFNHTSHALPRRFIIKELNKRPHFPSMQSLSDLLHDCNIDNLVLEINGSHLQEMKFPCVTTLNRMGMQEYVIIKSITQESVYIEGGEGSIPLREFLTVWQENPILLYDTDDYRPPQALEDYHKRNQKIFLTLLATIGSLLGVVCLKVLTLSAGWDLMAFFTLFLLSGLGLFVSSLIVRKSLGQSNEALNRFCWVKKADGCDMILRSSLAYILPGISWASLGFIFFSGVLLYYLISPLPTLAAIGFWYLVSIPGVVLALLIQHFLSELWCRLCLIIHAILIVGALVALWLQGAWVWPDAISLLYLAISVLLGWVGWQVFNHYIENTSKTASVQHDLSASKFHPLTIFGHFSQLTPLPFSIDPALRVGEGPASVMILFVTNPTCPKCAEAHHHLERIFRKHDEINLLFLFHTYQGERESVELVRYFYRLYKKDVDLFTDALENWYSDIDQSVEKWKEKYIQHLQISVEEGNDLPLIDHNAVEQVPAIYLNGAKLPDFYEVSDISDLLPWLKKEEQGKGAL